VLPRTVSKILPQIHTGDVRQKPLHCGAVDAVLLHPGEMACDGFRVLLREQKGRRAGGKVESGRAAFVCAELGSVRPKVYRQSSSGPADHCRRETCHGDQLNGVGPIPGLAGRSPSYLVRQLYDFQHGTRAGPWSPLMAPNVINLTLDDMVALAAYAASLPP
jgi:cytochrome c553